MSSYARERAADRIAHAAQKGLDLVGFWEEVRPALDSTVPYHLTPCWYTLDPASLLATSHHDHGMITELPSEWLAHEYEGDDFNSMAEVARSPAGTGTLHEATGGDPSRSERWSRYIEPYGGEQELLVALRTTSGQVWGILALYRAPGQPEFDDDERRFLRELAPYLAEGARRGLLIGDASEPDGPEAPGLIVLDQTWQVESVTPGVERWLDELPGGEWQAAQRLPTCVVSVAARALRSVDANTPGKVAVARVLSSSGRWMTLHGASMVGGDRPRVAVIVEPAHPARISPLLMSAYALTEREQEVTQLVLRGESTTQIVAELGISAHTVQQHLKSIFEKTGVRSRRDLVSKVFFSHYEPRFRDNERRAIEGRPLRGAPSAEA